ncbi:MAG: hypothetical protein U9N53_07710 [Bacteroidota bacterium]|nr:hypothetical protein [Bacteroidota bacterium]
MKTPQLFFLLLISYFAIAQENGIIFQENFETGTIQEIVKSWSDSKNTSGMFLSEDVPKGSQGTRSLIMTHSQGNDVGGYLYKMFPEAYDSLFARFYVKFCANHSSVHHFVHMGGYNPPTTWPQGGAGVKPTGKERFTTGIEPIGDNWSWDFYSYWMHMRGCARPGYFWGNIFNPQNPAPINLDEWICVEFMMKINDPVDTYTGEQAFWINGEKIHHLGGDFPDGYWIWDKFIPHSDSLPFEGFQWRNDEKLKLNFFWLLYYMTDGVMGKSDTIWFDDIVISTDYIGPDLFCK